MKDYKLSLAVFRECRLNKHTY